MPAILGRMCDDLEKDDQHNVCEECSFVRGEVQRSAEVDAAIHSQGWWEDTSLLRHMLNFRRLYVPRRLHATHVDRRVTSSCINLPSWWHTEEPQAAMSTAAKSSVLCSQSTQLQLPSVAAIWLQSSSFPPPLRCE